MAARNTLFRYGAVAMTFHWVIAALILFNFPFGIYVVHMADEDPNHFAFVTIHKSIGLTVLVLALARLIWRLVDPAPVLPPTMPKWERVLAKVSHYMLYGLIFLVPLSGWALVSPSRIPIMYFGLIHWPSLPFISREFVGQYLKVCDPGEACNSLDLHWVLASTMMYLLIVHVLAALKHQFVDRDTVLKRMLPGTKVGP